MFVIYRLLIRFYIASAITFKHDEKMTPERIRTTQNNYSYKSYLRCMLNTIRNNRHFLLVWLIFFIAGLMFTLSINKHDLHLLMTSWHVSAADFFFRWITYLGDGAILGFPILGTLFFYRREAGAQLLLSFFIAGGITQLLKHGLYADELRPFAEIGSLPAFRAVDGVSFNSNNSFPSGHTTTAFSFFLSLSIYSKNNRLKLLWVVLALLASYSRIHISQHYLRDVLAGSLIGITATIPTWHLVKSFKIPLPDQPLLFKWKRS